jgi:hypothetical protein
MRQQSNTLIAFISILAHAKNKRIAREHVRYIWWRRRPLSMSVSSRCGAGSSAIGEFLETERAVAVKAVRAEQFRAPLIARSVLCLHIRDGQLLAAFDVCTHGRRR